MPDTLNDRIEAHEATAAAASSGRWTVEGACIGSDDGLVARAVYLSNDARHIAANDPATIKAFCAVVKAAQKQVDYCGLDPETCMCDPEDCDTCPTKMLAKPLAALYDALRKE